MPASRKTQGQAGKRAVITQQHTSSCVDRGFPRAIPSPRGATGAHSANRLAQSLGRRSNRATWPCQRGAAPPRHGAARAALGPAGSATPKGGLRCVDPTLWPLRNLHQKRSQGFGPLGSPRRCHLGLPLPYYLRGPYRALAARFRQDFGLSGLRDRPVTLTDPTRDAAGPLKRPTQKGDPLKSGPRFLRKIP
jgi:hypothetical protein